MLKRSRRRPLPNSSLGGLPPVRWEPSVRAGRDRNGGNENPLLAELAGLLKPPNPVRPALSR